jgi:3-oxoacyl-(acyl-carrier-protein) synthase
MCVERPVAARARGATIRAYIAGYGTAFEAPLSPAALVHASADPVRRAIESALEDASLAPEDIDAVCGSASGLEAMDHEERTGIAAALGHDVAIATPKAIFGETFGGGGAIGMATTLAWFEGAPVAPIAHGKAPTDLRAVVVTTVGFYGNVSAVVLKKPAS